MPMPAKFDPPRRAGRRGPAPKPLPPPPTPQHDPVRELLVRHLAWAGPLSLDAVADYLRVDWATAREIVTNELFERVGGRVELSSLGAGMWRRLREGKT